MKGRISEFTLSELPEMLKPESPEAQESIQSIRSLAHAFIREASLARLEALASGYEHNRVLDQIRNSAEQFKQSFSADDVRDVVKFNWESPEKIVIALQQLNPDVQVRCITDERIYLKAPALKRIPSVPEGYGFKGGVARLALSALLGENVSGRTARDIDLVRVGDTPNGLDQKLALEIMGEDAKYGASVELIASVPVYMNSRDLSINEILLINEEVVASFAAIRDSLNGVINPTEHVLDSQGLPPGNIMMKMLRMKVLAELEGKIYSLGCEPAVEQITPFDIALNLDRALCFSNEAGERLVAECVARGILALDRSRGTVLTRAMKTLAGSLREGMKFFSSYQSDSKTGPGAETDTGSRMRVGSPGAIPRH